RRRRSPSTRCLDKPAPRGFPRGMRTTLLLSLVMAGTALAVPLDWATPVQPIGAYKSDSDAYIDDSYALRDDGKAIAYITTDGASKASLHLADVPPSGPGSAIAGAPPNTSAIYWLGP